VWLRWLVGWVVELLVAVKLFYSGGWLGGADVLALEVLAMDV